MRTSNEEQCFPAVMFVVSWRVYGWNLLTCDHSNESHRALTTPVVLFVMLYKLVREFESVDELFKCELWSSESLWSVFFFITQCCRRGFERLGSLWNHGVIQTLLQFKSTVWIRLVVAASRTIKSHAYNTHDTTGTWIQSWTDLHINLLNGLTR